MFDAPAETAPSQEDSARRKAQLVRLAAIGMGMAEKINDDFEAAETPQERRDAMGDFPGVARLVQRAIFLEAKLERDDRAEARLMAQDAAKASDQAIQRRKAQVEAVVGQVIDIACDGDLDRHFEASESLRWRLDDSFLERDFADKPLDKVIAVLCKSAGLPNPGPIGDDTDLWAIGLKKGPPEPKPVEEPIPQADDDLDADGLDVFGRRPPVTSSA